MQHRSAISPFVELIVRYWCVLRAVRLETLQLLPKAYSGVDYVAGLFDPRCHGNRDQRSQQPFNVNCQRHVRIDDNNNWLVIILFCLLINYYALSGEIALTQEIPPIATHFSLAWSVCLSSFVCHIRAPCLTSIICCHLANRHDEQFRFWSNYFGACYY